MGGSANNTNEATRRTDADWEADLQLRLERSERRAWMVAKGSIVVTMLALAAVVAQGALRQVVPLPVVVDKTTGEVTIQQRLAAETIPLNEALDKHHVARFVKARQAYTLELPATGLQRRRSHEHACSV